MALSPAKKKGRIDPATGRTVSATTRVAPKIVPTTASGYSVGGPGGDQGRSTYSAAATAPIIAAPRGPGSGDYPKGLGSDFAQTPFGQMFPGSELGRVTEDPQALVTNFYKYKGLSQLGGGYANALDDSQKLGLLYLLLNNSPDMAKYGNAGEVDWTGRFLEQGNRPGSAGVGPQDIAGAMFNAPENSPVWNALYGTVQNPQEQVDNWLNTLGSGLQGTMPEPIYQALMARYQQAGRDFAAIRQTSPGGPTSFGEYLEKVGLGGQTYGL